MSEKTSKKSTVAEIQGRVGDVYAMLLDGHTRTAIHQYAAKWAVSERQIDEYIAKANAAIKEVNSLTLQQNQGLILSNLWQLFRECRGFIAEEGVIRGRDISEQHKILMSIAKLKGLDQMTVNHVIEDKRDLAEMSDEELETIIVEAPKELGEQ